MNTVKKLFLFFLVLCIGNVFAQDVSSEKDGRSFRGIKLLSTYDEVTQQIKKDNLLILSPSSDFEDFDDDIPNWIIAKMPPLMNNIYYHFLDNKLYVISIFFNPKKTSYSELYATLKTNYGKPMKMNASESKWELPNNTMVVLDTLPSIKYIDTTIFDRIKQSDGTKDPLQSLEEQEKAMEAQILADL